MPLASTVPVKVLSLTVRVTTSPAVKLPEALPLRGTAAASDSATFKMLSVVMVSSVRATPGLVPLCSA